MLLKNFRLMRYAEVLLLAAEAHLKNSNASKAAEYVNLVRQRAKLSNKATVSMNDVMLEKRLELCAESVRFQDMVRWGIAAEEINAYFNVEKTRRIYLSAAKFTKNRDEYFPIPEQQISYVKGLYKQNYGW
jgi:hypothetical protein